MFVTEIVKAKALKQANAKSHDVLKIYQLEAVEAGRQSSEDLKPIVI